GLYQNAKGLWDACKKASYSFPFTDVKKWLDGQAMDQIYRLSPKNIPYSSYSKITKPNTVHQCDLIEIPECERFARRIVDNMNDSPTQLIGMRPNDAMKLER
ncbi:16165_t:CDS:2, partial [Funneliformis geosporum]